MAATIATSVVTDNVTGVSTISSVVDVIDGSDTVLIMSNLTTTERTLIRNIEEDWAKINMKQFIL